MLGDVLVGAAVLFAAGNVLVGGLIAWGVSGGDGTSSPVRGLLGVGVLGACLASLVSTAWLLQSVYRAVAIVVFVALVAGSSYVLAAVRDTARRWWVAGAVVAAGAAERDDRRRRRGDPGLRTRRAARGARPDHRGGGPRDPRRHGCGGPRGASPPAWPWSSRPCARRQRCSPSRGRPVDVRMRASDLVVRREPSSTR